MTLAVIQKQRGIGGRLFHLVVDHIRDGRKLVETRELKRFYGGGAEARANHHLQYLNILAERAAKGGAQ